MKVSKKEGFTLLEIIVVIIIVGVLASLALPRLFATVEFSRSAEALNSFIEMRQSMERCFIQNGGRYDSGAGGVNCGAPLTTLDMEDPGASPGARFSYVVSGHSATGYVITATRVGADAPSGTNTITLTASATGVNRGGTGVYSSISGS